MLFELLFIFDGIIVFSFVFIFIFVFVFIFKFGEWEATIFGTMFGVVVTGDYK